MQIVYYPKGKISLLNAELYQLELMVMISFLFSFRVSWLLNKGFLMSIIWGLWQWTEMVSKLKDACVL
jgi:hypothetical protein